MNQGMEHRAAKPVIEVATDGGNDTALDTYVRAAKGATIYHLSSWRHLITELFGHETLCVYARASDGAIVGILPLVRIASRLFGNYMVSMPYVNYGGAVADTAVIAEELMERAEAVAQYYGCSHVEFRDTVPHGTRWKLRTDKVAMVLSLPSSVDALWKAVGTKCRAQVKRPLREGASAVHGGVELLPDFYRVFARNMRDLGTPVYPLQFFRSVWERFRDDAKVVTVRMNDRPIAAAFLLRDGNRMEVPWASSLRETNAIGSNMLLYWSLLEVAVAAGCNEFDFGRSSVGSGTWKFKLQWGAQERQLYWHYWLAPGRSMPALTPHNPKYALAIKVWQRLPVTLSTFIGPHLVKNLP